MSFEKLGVSRYLPSQRAKDWWISHHGADIYGNGPRTFSDGCDSWVAGMTSYGILMTEALKSYVGPALASMGFTRSGRRAWTQTDLQVRAVVDPKANDRYRGGAFTLEFEISSDGRFESKLSGRVRIDQALDDDQRDAFLGLRNVIAQRLVTPPTEHLALIPPSVKPEYLKPFSTVADLERRFWMRFRTREDLTAWCDLIVPNLPQFMARVRTLSAHELYLGRSLRW